jgi:hypothetical protein
VAITLRYLKGDRDRSAMRRREYRAGEA